MSPLTYSLVRFPKINLYPLRFSLTLIFDRGGEITGVGSRNWCCLNSAAAGATAADDDGATSAAADGNNGVASAAADVDFDAFSLLVGEKMRVEIGEVGEDICNDDASGARAVDEVDEEAAD